MRLADLLRTVLARDDPMRRHAGLMSAQEAFNQRLRVSRFLLASTFSILYVVVLAIYYTQDKVDRDTLAEASAIVVVAILLFFALFRLRLNLRFPDPSLTAPQVMAAVCTMLFVVYRAPETRGVFAAFFFVALVFGMLRARARELAILGAVSLAGFALVSWLRYAVTRDAEMLRLDMLQLGVTALTFPWLVFIGSRVRQLKDADRRKDDFLATLAHELRNPLAPIRTGVQILRMTVSEPRAQTTILPMIERQLQHLTRLLDDLLDVNRITRGKIALHVERADLRDAVHAAVEASRGEIDQMRHNFVVSLPDEPVWVDADPVRLAQIVSNLLNNAARYTPAGGRIALKVERHDDSVDVSVVDSGIGIPRERLDSVFEMFTQIGAAAPHTAAGLGIGLSLVKGLVALHGGTVEARSEGPGRGSEFRVRLPVKDAGPRETETRAHQHTRSGPLRVLVVDDNRDAASSLSAVVELMGHEVRIGYDGQRAIEIAEEFRPDVVLLDLGMPGIDGYETCRRIRRHAWGNEVRLVAVTGWGQDEDRRKSAAAGFDEHLVKPVKPEALEALLGDLRSPA
jgi:signal transduction histidine kinase